MLLVVTYSRAARRDLRNAVRAHEDTVVRQFGRAALLEATEFGAFLALRLRVTHEAAVQVERTRPLSPHRDVPEAVREAAAAYANRETPSTPYARFAAGRDLPTQERLKGREL